MPLFAWGGGSSQGPATDCTNVQALLPRLVLWTAHTPDQTPGLANVSLLPSGQVVVRPYSQTKCCLCADHGLRPRGREGAQRGQCRGVWQVSTATSDVLERFGSEAPHTTVQRHALARHS